MKKHTLFFVPFILSMLLVSSCADRDRTITVEELPAAAQTLLESYFSDVEVSYAKVDNDLFDKEYKVVFVDGMKVEFSKSGAWEKVVNKAGVVPVAIVPAEILTLIERQFPEHRVVGIERSKRRCEVRLDNGLELEFDKNYRLVEVDD